MPSWSLTLDVPEPDAEDAAALLLSEGAVGAEVRDASISPMPGAARPRGGRALVIAFFPSRADAERAAAALGRDGPVAEVADEDWNAAWKRGLAPFTIGRVFVRPSWIEADPPPGAVEVVLDPGMAFGTGRHATTALCLASIDRLLLERPGVDVLDVGTGSGLLAIAAAKLGAGRVAATDTDPEALRTARENALRNAVALELSLGSTPPEGAFPVVVANIVAGTLVALAPELARRVAPGGVVLVSGILAGQEGEVRAAYEAQGLVHHPSYDAAQGEWRLLALRRARGDEAGGAEGRS